MGVFAAGDIYNHMNAVHGGTLDGLGGPVQLLPPAQPVDLFQPVQPVPPIHLPVQPARPALPVGRAERIGFWGRLRRSVF